MTFTEILADCYRRLNFGTSPATDAQTLVKAYANETHRAILTLPGLESLRDDTITVASVANAPRAALPPDVARIKNIQDRSNQFILRELTLTELRRRDPGLSATGNPWAFAFAGTLQVASQPSSATGVWAVSSSASDTAPTVNVQAVRTGGYLHTPSAATLTGTTRVQIGSQTDYVEITKFYLSAACVGDVTLYDAASNGNVLAVIPKGQTFARYLAVHWHPVPVSAITYYVDYTRVIPDLVNGTDEPLLPLDFHDLIGLGVRKKQYEKTQDDRYATVAAEYELRVNALRQWVQSDGTFVLSLRPRRRTSMLPEMPLLLGGIVSQISGEVPSGSINSSNRVYTTANAYRSTFLNVYLNGLRQQINVDYTETTTTTFTMTSAPTTGSSLTVDYIRA